MAVRMLGPQVQYFRKTAQAPTMTTSQNFLSVQFRGKSYTIALDPISATCSDLLDALQQAIPGLAAETLKVLVSKPKAHSVQLTQQLDQNVSHAGITPGSRCMLLGSYISELQALQDNKKAEASLRLADFDHEIQRVRLRSSNRPGHNTTPPGVHHFGGFQVLPLPPAAAAAGGVPPPAAALSLLHQLAADPAVVHVMNKHHWRVGLLSEMAAAGRVGVSAVCVLGYNVNQGQEISLRLRTDDYRGFRKYLRIRETLMHELAHMVYTEHDNNFKALNSQLLREVAEYESTAAAARGGRTLAGEGVFDDKDHWLGGQQQQQGVAAAAAVSQGRTLGGTSAAAGSSLRAARHAAAAAALARWQQQQPSQVSERESKSHEAAAAAAAANSDPIPAYVLDEVMQQADDGEQSITGGAAGAGAGAWFLDDSLSDDPATAAAEEEMRRLGSMNIQQQQQHVLQDDGLQAEADNQKQQQQWQHEQPSTLHEGMRQQQQEQHQQHVVADPGMDAVASDVSTHEAVIRSEHQSEHQAKGVETADNSTAAAVSTNPEGIVVVDDVVTEKLQQAQTYLQQLQQQAGNSSTAALQAVEGVLDSIVQYPGEMKYRRLRCSNSAYQRRIGQYAAAVQLLTLAGFSQQQEWVTTAGPEAVMVYVRDDPGLLWLVLSVVREQLHHQQ